MNRNRTSRGTVAFTALLVSLALGTIALKGMDTSESSNLESYVSVPTVRSVAQVERFSKVAYFDDGLQVRVRIFSGEDDEVIVLAQEMRIGDQQFEHMREVTRVRSHQSWESIEFYTNGGSAKCVIEPETTWGGVHDDIGFGANIRFEAQ